VHKIIWSDKALGDVRAFGQYLVKERDYEPDYASQLCDRILESPRYLNRFPKLRSEAPDYGEGIRKIVVLGHLVLYEIDDAQKVIRILAVVGQRQAPRKLR